MKDIIKKFLELNEKQINVAVVGDFLIDEYYLVIADRISPEFSIPILVSENLGNPTLAVAGGAGNVQNQFKHFNVNATLYSFINTYAASISNCRGCVLLPEDMSVPIKRRFYQGDFPLCRWDIERPFYGFGNTPAGKIALEQHQKMLLDKFLINPKPDVVILSDYDKGVFALDGKKKWRFDDIPTIVDPKKGPLEHWEGCYIFKPNNKEAKELSGGLTRWQDQCKYFYQTLKCKAVIITHGGDGVMGIVDGKFFEYHPMQQTIADSVIGAGDAYAAFLAMGVAHNLSIQESAMVAFEAGAVYVGKRHNEPVSPNELLKKIDIIAAKLTTPPVKVDRAYKLVMINSNFETINYNCLSLLQKAKTYGDKLVVGVYRDGINSLEQRMKTIAGLECVDFVVVFDPANQYNHLKHIKPDILIDTSNIKDGFEFVGDVVKLDG